MKSVLVAAGVLAGHNLLICLQMSTETGGDQFWMNRSTHTRLFLRITVIGPFKMELSTGVNNFSLASHRVFLTLSKY
jgi:hypothetical protein